MKKVVTILLAAASCFQGLFAQEVTLPRYTDVSILYIQPEGTTVRAGYQYRNDKNSALTWDGTGLSLGEFVAKSHKVMDSGSSAVQGGVSYQRGVKKKVLWNTSSDFDLLYPYVMADTVGGNLQMEQYSFFGRYAKIVDDSWEYGLSGSYRALHEYRQTDPRPRNITSDLSISGSIGYRRVGNYSISLLGAYRRYHQLQAVSFMNPRGANTAEFHFTGLGSHYARFAGNGTFTDLRYRGSGFTVAAQLLPAIHTGSEYQAGLSYSSFKSTRHLVNQNEVPYSELLTQNLKASVSYLGSIGKIGITATLDLGYELRLGSEAIVPSIISSGVEDLPKLTLYRNRIPSALLKGQFTLQKGNNTWSLTPRIGFEMSDATRKDSGSKMNTRSISTGATAGLATLIKSIQAKFWLTGIYTIRPEGEFKLPASTSPFLYNRYTDIYEYFTENMTEFSFQAKLGKSLMQGKLSLFVNPVIGARFWGKDGSSTYISISTGVEF